MTPHYGKREPGALTASSPGDTLYFNFASYNDSGDSEALTGLAVTDIEVFKNGNAATRATDSGYSLISDTGQIGDRVGLYRFSVQLFNTADDTGHYESGAWYQVAVDSVGIDGKTVRFWVGSFEIGRQRVDVRAVNGDTGAAAELGAAFANGFSDTGITNRFDRIQSEVDTGLRVHIDDSDTGIKDTIADLDTGLRAQIALQDTGFTANAVWNALRPDHTTASSFGQHVIADVNLIDGDTGPADNLGRIAADTGQGSYLYRLRDTGGISDAIWAYATRALTAFSHDTGVRDTVWKTQRSGYDGDTGSMGYAIGNLLEVGGDTGAAIHIKQIYADGFADTGIQNRLDKIQSDTDTGLHSHISDVDTGLHDTIADLDTGLRDYINDTDTGLRAHIDDLDTGIKNRFDDLAEDTGGVNLNAIQGDTGAAGWLKAIFANGFNDTGLQERLARIQSDVDTGLRTHIDDSDTGLKDVIADLDTGLRDYIDNTDTGLRAHIDDLDTGIKNRFDAMAEDTGGVNINAIAGDTGAASRLQQFAGTKLSSSGMLDTGTLAGTRAGTIDANVVAVNETPVQGDGSSGNEWRPS